MALRCIFLFWWKYLIHPVNQVLSGFMTYRQKQTCPNVKKDYSIRMTSSSNNYALSVTALLRSLMKQTMHTRFHFWVTGKGKSGNMVFVQNNGSLCDPFTLTPLLGSYLLGWTLAERRRGQKRGETKRGKERQERREVLVFKVPLLNHFQRRFTITEIKKKKEKKRKTQRKTTHGA